jgi:hypothetical protein
MVSFIDYFIHCITTKANFKCTQKYYNDPSLFAKRRRKLKRVPFSPRLLINFEGSSIDYLLHPFFLLRKEWKNCTLIMQISSFHRTIDCSANDGDDCDDESDVKWVLETKLHDEWCFCISLFLC